MVRITFYSSKPYDKAYFQAGAKSLGFHIEFQEVSLNRQTAVLAKGSEVVCVFVNDRVDADVIHVLAAQGVKLIALRCAGFNHVDLAAAKANGMQVVRVPAYSPYAVAEHTLALILTLNRKTHRAYNRVREGNFALSGLVGFDLRGKTVGLIGLGKIGLITAEILRGFGCRILGFDVSEPSDLEERRMQFVSLQTLFAESDIISLHCPLTPETRHLIDETSIKQMKRGVMLINTSRGALIDTKALIPALKNGHIGYLGLDVYEEEEHLFFEDLSATIIQDDVFMRLLSFNNVLITGHQAFLTEEALTNIADTTLDNIRAFAEGLELKNLVTST